MTRLRTLIVALAAAACGTPALALTNMQETVMNRHGVWEWSIRNCSDIHRGRRYWYFLKEAGEFRSLSQITENEDGEAFKEGWQFMQNRSERFGLLRTCDYAMKQWPAILWRKRK